MTGPHRRPASFSPTVAPALLRKAGRPSVAADLGGAVALASPAAHPRDLLSRVAVMSVARQLASTGTATATIMLSGPGGGATTGPVTYSVSVTGDGTDGTPSGTVTIDDTVNQCTAPLDGSGNGSCQLGESASVSPYSVTATYNGDDVYASVATTISETVAQALPAVVLTGLAGSNGVVTYDVTVSGLEFSRRPGADRHGDRHRQQRGILYDGHPRPVRQRQLCDHGLNALYRHGRLRR